MVETPVRILYEVKCQSLRLALIRKSSRHISSSMVARIVSVTSRDMEMPSTCVAYTSDTVVENSRLQDGFEQDQCHPEANHIFQATASVTLASAAGFRCLFVYGADGFQELREGAVASSGKVATSS